MYRGALSLLRRSDILEAVGRRLPYSGKLETMLFRQSFRGQDTVEIGGIHGHSLTVSTSDRQSRGLFRRRTMASDTTEAVFEIVQEDWVVVDVGAHIGYFSLLFANQVGPAGHVHAFEPSPENRALLRQNINENGYEDRVSIQGEAVGATTGSVELHLNPENHGNHTIKSVDHRLYPIRDRESVKVNILPLDSMDIPRIDLVKIDVEGAEPDVLEGMKDTIAQHQPHLLLEFLPQYWEKPPEQVLNSLDSFGYSFYRLEEGVLREQLNISRVISEKSSIHDLLAVHQNKSVDTKES